MRWEDNQLYWTVQWDDITKLPSLIHLDHCIIRSLKSIREHPLDRSKHLLKSIAQSDDDWDKKMEIEESPNLQIKPKKADKKKFAKIKPRDNQGDERRKWCPVETCKHHRGKD